MRGKQQLSEDKDVTSPGDNTVPGWSEELGTRLKWVIKLIGSQKRAAEIAKIKPEMLGKYIAGRAKPNIYTIVRLLDETGVSADWLLFGQEPRKRLGASESRLSTGATAMALEVLIGETTYREITENPARAATRFAELYQMAQAAFKRDDLSTT